MNNTKNDTIKVEYDGLENITYEKLNRGVFYAEINSTHCTLSEMRLNENVTDQMTIYGNESDLILDIEPIRHYEGKTPDDNAKTGFIISCKCAERSINFHDKIAFDIDGERLVAEVHNRDRIDFNEEECIYTTDEINGINYYYISVDDIDKIVFDLLPNDIRRIAEAQNVRIYFESDDGYNANGGDIEARDGTLLSIEGIQGVMKRAYHYFVDESCYADYAQKHYEFRKEESQRVNREKEFWEEKKRQREQEEQEEQNKVKPKDIIFVIALIVLIVSIILIIIGYSRAFLVSFGCILVMYLVNENFAQLIDQLGSKKNEQNE